MDKISIQKDGDEWIVVDETNREIYGRFGNVRDASLLLKELLSPDNREVISPNKNKPAEISISDYKELESNKQKDSNLLVMLGTNELLFLLLDNNLENDVKNAIANHIIDNRIDVDDDDKNIPADFLINKYLLKSDKDKLSKTILEDMRTRILILLLVNENVSIDMKPAIYNEVVTRFEENMNGGDSTNNSEVDSITKRKKLSKDEALLYKFNVGAFLLSIIWSIAYGEWNWALGLIFLSVIGRLINSTSGMLISLLGFYIASYILGSKANKIAWEKKGHKFGTINNMISAQEKWTAWGVAFTVIIFFIIVIQYG